METEEYAEIILTERAVAASTDNVWIGARLRDDGNSTVQACEGYIGNSADAVTIRERLATECCDHCA